MKRPLATFYATAEHNEMLLRDFLRQHVGISRKRLAEIKFGDGELLINHKQGSVRDKVYDGDVITIVFSTEKPSTNIEPTYLELSIVYEDDHLLVINKPSGITTIPTDDPSVPSIAAAVLFYYQEIGHQATFHPVSRLDKHTSGLLVIAKHSFIHDQLQISTINKTYYAVCEGILPFMFTSIHAPIGRKTTSIIEREVRADGKVATTHLKKVGQNNEYTRLRLSLETGRTHQIRVHLAWLGHPLAGDTLYGALRHTSDRYFLHVEELLFSHPITNECLCVREQPPETFRDL
ncbi:RluA family pseudouridine synthase [Paenalkalicoccus suaedae]|uniref:Pseudouridine synthase n=1 Tax=Paenalkalicoccus suaedae TaxID=2592382 RepID=A0A859FHR2_9BACI|nr:RluA family pseudouridine synthase [Paenalkalicoccus suaedae]QKS71755.1 RluA family pseudouridine synthase [Paenalkalicoccus suaedae]